MENIDILTAAGYVNPIILCTTEDTPTVVQTLTLHEVILHSKAELDQLAEGLSALGVLSVIRKTPEIIQKYFVLGQDSKLTAGILYRYIYSRLDFAFFTRSCDL